MLFCEDSHFSAFVRFEDKNLCFGRESEVGIPTEDFSRTDCMILSGEIPALSFRRNYNKK
ncbi:hypothetical protein A0128_02895 [Leptospira tipperaryensis]|uniref:Uncharacterized protein n=1 Tax=Leptospira tipperaryensis TaxID=2564040 RepID=A0A1D7UTP2_9LEPT|nr:hypothetical protein A0128_02895 [Leptospira tipperaryensis]